MKYRVSIREESSGIAKDVDFEADDDDIVRYQFETGNMSCDCNLHTEFHGLNFEDGKFPCGETAYTPLYFVDESGNNTKLERG